MPNTIKCPSLGKTSRNLRQALLQSKAVGNVTALSAVGIAESQKPLPYPPRHFLAQNVVRLVADDRRPVAEAQSTSIDLALRQLPERVGVLAVALANELCDAHYADTELVLAILKYATTVGREAWQVKGGAQ